MNLPQRAQITFTNAEFNRLVRSGGFGSARVELRRGLIVKMNPQHMPHARTKRLLAEALKAAIDRAQLTWVVDQEVSVDFADGFEPSPDIVVWDPDAVTSKDGPVPGAAVRLVVEVAYSSLGDDLGEMLEDYASAGLPEYWVADVKGGLILRHTTRAGNTYARRDPARVGEVFESLTQPTLTVDTTALT